MSTNTPQDGSQDLDAVKDEAYRLYLEKRAQRGNRPVVDRMLIEDVVNYIYSMLTQGDTSGNGSRSGKGSAFVTALALLFGAGIPSYGLIQNGNLTPVWVGLGSFLLGGLVVKLVPWWRR